MAAAAASIDPQTLARRLRTEASRLLERAVALRATQRSDAKLAAYGLEAAAERLRRAADEIARSG